MFSPYTRVIVCLRTQNLVLSLHPLSLAIRHLSLGWFTTWSLVLTPMDDRIRTPKGLFIEPSSAKPLIKPFGFTQVFWSRCGSNLLSSDKRPYFRHTPAPRSSAWSWDTQTLTYQQQVLNDQSQPHSVSTEIKIYISQFTCRVWLLTCRSALLWLVIPALIWKGRCCVLEHVGPQHWFDMLSQNSPWLKENSHFRCYFSSVRLSQPLFLLHSVFARYFQICWSRKIKYHFYSQIGHRE